MGQTRPVFLFSYFSQYNDKLGTKFDYKKCRWRAWDRKMVVADESA